MKNNIRSLVLILLAFGMIYESLAQDKELPIKELLEKKQFIFVPNSVIPQRGQTRFLNGYFDLKINSDSMVSYLPYFGRTTMAGYNPGNEGMRFTSTDFAYSYSPGKKNTWDVIMKINDQSDAYRYLMTVYSDGTSDLLITSNFRDQISFRGYIKAIKKEP